MSPRIQLRASTSHLRASPFNRHIWENQGARCKVGLYDKIWRKVSQYRNPHTTSMHHKDLPQFTFKFAQEISNRLTLALTSGEQLICPKAFQVSQGLLPSLQPLQGVQMCIAAPATSARPRQMPWMHLGCGGCPDPSLGVLVELMRKNECAGTFTPSRSWAPPVRRVTHDTLIKIAWSYEKSSFSIIFVKTRMMFGCWIHEKNINLGSFSSHDTLLLSQALQAV